ncbi:MAG: amidohydrolase [Pseudomonadota bacterium]
MQALTVALIQDALDWQQPAANRERFAARIAGLAAPSPTTPIDLVVLPEMFASGFTMAAAEVAEPMDGPSVTWMQQQAAEHNLIVTGSLVIEADGRFYNRLLWVAPDGSVQCYDKRHLFRMAGEHEVYTAGAALRVFAVKGWAVAPFICYDLRFPVWSRRRAGAATDYDLALYTANWPSPRHDAWETLLKARAMENQCYVVGVNRVGEDGNGMAYRGGSVALDFLGREVGGCGEAATSCVVTLSREKLERGRERFPLWRDADSFELT